MILPTPEDLETLSVSDLAELRVRVTQEEIRRDELTTIPTQVDLMVQRFVDHGGDKTKLKNPNSYTRGPKKK